MSETLALRVNGMTCVSCAQHVEEVLTKVPGVRNVQVAYPEGTARVMGASALDARALIEAVKAAGYGAALERHAERSEAGTTGVRDRALGWMGKSAKKASEENLLRVARETTLLLRGLIMREPLTASVKTLLRRTS